MSTDLISTTKNIQRHVGAVADGIYGPLTAAAIWRELNKDAVDVEDVTAKTQSAPDDKWKEGLDARTISNIETLDPKVRENFAQFTRLANATAATLGCSYVMIGGDRSWQEQDELYKIGRTVKGADVTKARPMGRKVTNARGGSSNHNFKVAGDYGVFRGKAYLDNSDPKTAAKVHRMCSEHAAACGLEWGGSWKSFKDLPHYEFSTGLTMAQKRAKFSKEGSIV